MKYRVFPFISFIIFIAAYAHAVDEMDLDRLFGIPMLPETDNVLNMDKMNPCKAFDASGIKHYNLDMETSGIYARKFGMLRRNVELGSLTFPLKDILEPETSMIGQLNLELSLLQHHSFTFGYFSSAFTKSRNTLEAKCYSLLYDYKVANEWWGFFAVEIGVDEFDSHSEFIDWFFPSGPPLFISDQRVINPLIGFKARLKTSALSAIEFGYRGNPSPIEWMNTNVNRADVKWEVVVLSFASLSVGYDLYDIRFQRPSQGESADMTQHGPYLSLGLFF
jgi:hypothetical protein